MGQTFCSYWFSTSLCCSSKALIMCLHPNFIPNPNYKRPKKGFNLLKDCTSLYIPIPCGHCPQCIAMRQLSIVQRVYMESINNYLYFATLTYSDSALPSIVIGDYDISYADFKDVQKMFKRLRKNNSFTRPFKYFVVSEFGSKSGRPHFHIIFSIPKYIGDTVYTPFELEQVLYRAVFLEWRRNYGTVRKPSYRSNFEFHRKFVGGRVQSNFDLHYIIPNLSDSGVSSTAYYVSKYMLKPSQKDIKLQQALKMNLSDEEYKSIWKDVRNIHTMSKGFGLKVSAPNHIKFDSLGFDCSIVDYILKSIRTSIIDGLKFPCFIIPDSGTLVPLSRLYRRYFLSADDAFAFYYNNGDSKYLDTLFDTVCYDDSRFNEMIRQFQKNLNIVDSQDISEF